MQKKVDSSKIIKSLTFRDAESTLSQITAKPQSSTSNSGSTKKEK
ncbi:hypothetical protein [Bacillus sp. FJAT-45037]|nr:hypothetical protein [Bacillus sp. FJAT-45037]